MSPRPLRLLALLALAACGKDSVSINEDSDAPATDSAVEGDADADSDADSDTDSDSDADLPCEAEIISVTPEDGDVEVAVDATIVALFSAEVTEADASLSLTGPDGLVGGELTMMSSGLGLSFTPSAPLERDAEYTISAEVCEDAEVAAFTTLGDPVSDVAGYTYDVNLADVTWNSPKSASLLIGSIETSHLLFMVETIDTDAGTIELVGAAGWDDPNLEQYPCASPINFDPADFTSNPSFAVGPADATLVVSGYDVNVWDLGMSGTFAEDGESILNVQITGMLDVREFTVGSVEACDAVIFLGDKCVACPNDGVEGCLEVDATMDAAYYAPTVTLDPDLVPEC
ncbi:Ig-like domain-containing protein [Myxococcota bacterium]|nr:Ig-like domain-containing protein [Myxococcota bacterium]